ncbi:VOC family protein [Archangium sp.]|uniref:VOC family protein n=1 Tax=Archangium sp. TaxID=1872627 RepID=UPI00389B20B8
MIRGLHGLFYSSEPEAARTFLRDKLKLPYSDVGEGWLIFDLPEGDLGIHPTDPGQAGGGHDVSFYCDDLPGTVADLKSRGVEFDGDIADHGYGLVTYFRIPGGLRVQLYEPRYQKRSAQAPRKVAKKAAKTAKTAVKKAAAKAKTAVKKVAAKAKRVVGKAKPAAKRGSTAKRGR